MRCIPIVEVFLHLTLDTSAHTHTHTHTQAHAHTHTHTHKRTHARTLFYFKVDYGMCELRSALYFILLRPLNFESTDICRAFLHKSKVIRSILVSYEN